MSFGAPAFGASAFGAPQKSTGFGAASSTGFGSGAAQTGFGPSAFGSNAGQQQQGGRGQQKPETLVNPGADLKLQSTIGEGVSGNAFAPTQQSKIIAVSGWDGMLRIWDLGSGNTGNPDLTVDVKTVLGDPPPSACMALKWAAADSKQLYFANSQGKIACLDMMRSSPGNPAVQGLGQHGNTVSCIETIPEQQLVVSGGWDGMLKYWDVRQAPASSPVGIVTLPERVYSMSRGKNCIGIACADRVVAIVDVTNPGKVMSCFYSPLRRQTRCITTWPDDSSIALGSAGSRCAVLQCQSLARLPQNRAPAEANAIPTVLTPQMASALEFFTFKAGRAQEPTSVTSIAVQPVGSMDCFATTGSDGSYRFWHRSRRQPLQAYGTLPAGVQKGAFSPDGTLFAYAVGYAWDTAAHQNWQPGSQYQIQVHQVQSADSQ
eukprot:Clim_evm39s221 gene=Clim_evmTU39s221